MAGGRILLFYDADCRICSFLQRWVHRLDRSGRIRSIPLGSSEADAYLGALDDSERFGSMHVVGPDGRRETKGMALLRLVEALPMGRGAAGVLRGRERGREAAEWVYGAFLRLREALAR